MWIIKWYAADIWHVNITIDNMSLKIFSGVSSTPADFNRWSAMLLVILIVIFVGSQVYLGITSYFER
jgi:hypothetical protein